MEGYVLKWTNFIIGYKTRYLMLQDNLLYCLKHKYDKKTKAIDLKLSKVIDDKKKNFIIETEKKKFYFKTNTDNEKKGWICILLEASLKCRRSIYTEKDKLNIQDSITGLRNTMVSQRRSTLIEEIPKVDFVLKKTDSCVVENFVEVDLLPQIDEYLQDTNLVVNPSKNKRFSAEYNAYYQEINKNKTNLRLNKFENVVNSYQNLQNLILEMNTVMENFNLLLMSSKFKCKDNFTKIYEDMFNIKQEIKEQLDISVKNFIEYKEDGEIFVGNKVMNFEKHPEVLKEKDETFFEAKEQDEDREKEKEMFEENLIIDIRYDDKNDQNEDKVSSIEAAKINFDYQNLNIYGDNISVDEDDDSSFEDCISQMNDLNKEDNQFDLEFKNSLEKSIIQESKENEGKFKRSLSLHMVDFKDANYYFEQRNLKSYPKIKCSNSMLSDLIKSLTKDKISLPIHYNEPISMLQKQCEKFQYGNLLTQAVNILEEKNPIYLRMCYIAAFIASELSLNVNRILKPFNPILGETFEYFDNNLKYRFLSEQVSHNPPISAYICESEDYAVYSDTRCKNKFKFLKGAMEITFQSKSNVLYKQTAEHFVYNKPTVFLKGLILGTPHYDFSGIVTIQELNYKGNQNIKTVLDFFEEGRKSKPLGYFEGKVFDESNNVVYLIKGNWNTSMYITDKNGKNEKEIWKVNDEPFMKNTDYINNYMMPNYSCNLNHLPKENESGLIDTLPPTDSRLRTDQRALEVGNLAEAESEKNRIENNQRIRHKKFEEEKIKYEPNYFADVCESKTLEYVYIYKGGYWEDRRSRNFERLHNIFK